MKRRGLDLCLLALPRARRQRDGEMLRDLALDLAERNGLLKEMGSLLRLGASERIRSARRKLGTWRRRRRFAFAAIVATAMSAIAIPLALGQSTSQLDQFTCSPESCDQVERLVETREKEGWDCSSAGSLSGEREWKCTSG